MERVGRNERCPCGSGRKFKRCCQPYEAERARFVEVVVTVAVPLLSRLAKFAQSVAGASIETVAREDFPFWRGPTSRRQGARIVDHLMFDARPKTSGRRTIDVFEAEVGPTLDEGSRAMLARWVQAPRRLYRIANWSGGFTECVDLLAEDAASISVFDIEESWRPALGEAVALRPLPAGTGFFCAGRPIDFGKRDTADVADRMRRRHLDFVRNERIVSLDEFLRVASTALDEEAERIPAASIIIVPGA